MTRTDDQPRCTCTLEGIGVSPGFAIGRAHLVHQREVQVSKFHLQPAEIEREIARLHEAVEQSAEQIREIQARFRDAGEEHRLILDAHLLMLQDEMLIGRTVGVIRQQSINAEWALSKIVRSIKSLFDEMDDEYFRERRADVDYVSDRVMRNLMGHESPSLSQVEPGAIVVAHDLSPADTALLMRCSLLGFVTEVGGKTSHTAIMARSLELPAVVGLEDLTDKVGTGDTLVLDGVSGRVLVNPTPEDLVRYQQMALDYKVRKARFDQRRKDPAVTRDGVELSILGNIELPEEAAMVLNYGAEGIGLFRSEYLYMNQQTLPSEAEQYRHYQEVLEICGSRGATIRTLDLGGDKFIEALRLNRELNPIMGLRAIRFCLKQPKIFRTQLRALLRASVHGKLRLMVPLINSVEEIHAVKAHIASCKAELLAEGHPVADDIPLGIMIELPSAATIADILAEEVDFFSIGTNDLIQYTLAVDRANEHVAHMYQPLHPALLRMLRFVVKSARDAGIGVAMCGEMAGDAFYLPVLIGLGLRELSMNTVAIPMIKSVTRAVSVADCEALVNEIMAMDRAEVIVPHVAERLRSVVKDLKLPELYDSTTH